MTSPQPEGSMRILVADDEPAARDKLLRLLRVHADVDVVGTAQDGKTAARAIADLEPDVVLLDIRMPELDGFATLDEAGRNGKPAAHVVFVTAYDEYALRAFEVRALDYLLKPFDAARLDETLDRVRRQLALEQRPEVSALGRTLAQLGPPTSE